MYASVFPFTFLGIGLLTGSPTPSLHARKSVTWCAGAVKKHECPAGQNTTTVLRYGQTASRLKRRGGQLLLL